MTDDAWDPSDVEDFWERVEQGTVARTSDPGTSQAAAASVKNLPQRRDDILACLAKCGPSADEDWVNYYEANYEAEGWWKQGEGGLRTQRLWLVKHGYVKDTGSKKLTQFNRWAIIWAVVRSQVAVSA